MNTDIRIACDNPDHPKIEKLYRLLGEPAYRCLIRFWCFIAINHPTGKMNGMDPLDVDIAAGWKGDPGTFLQALLEVRLVDEIDGQYEVHEWEFHQAYVVAAPERKIRAIKGNVAAKINRGMMTSLEGEKYLQERISVIKSATSTASSVATSTAKTLKTSATSTAPPPPPPPPPSPKKNLRKDSSDKASDSPEKKTKRRTAEDWIKSDDPAERCQGHYVLTHFKRWGFKPSIPFAHALPNVRTCLKRGLTETQVKNAMDYFIGLDPADCDEFQVKWVAGHKWEMFIRHVDELVISEDVDRKERLEQGRQGMSTAEPDPVLTGLQGGDCDEF